jgi:hypothetical protein
MRSKNSVVLGNSNKWVFVLLPLLVLSVANAAPTVSSYNNGIVSAVLPTSNAHITSVPEVIQVDELSDFHLARAAAEFLKPPPTFTGSEATPVGAKSLPAVPGALLMGLTGFLCVSLVKDRRFWLAALTGLLSVGQTGIQAVPQLAMHFSHRNHIEQQFDAELTYPYTLENSRLRSDVEGTQYIGLLHHLAGIPPDGKMSLLSQESGQTGDEFRAPQFAIIGLSPLLNPALNCLAAKVERIIYFSPAFIFDNLARGPPKLT